MPDVAIVLNEKLKLLEMWTPARCYQIDTIILKEQPDSPTCVKYDKNKMKEDLRNTHI